MLRLAKQEDEKRVLEYLENDLGNCVYLYMDIKKYHLGNGYIPVWINRGETPTTVVMRYFDSLQVYGDEKSSDISGISECIQRENVQMISGQKWLIDKVKRLGNMEKDYESKDGYVFSLENYRIFPYEGIECAKEEDCDEIASLICMDEEFAGNYHVNNLARQLGERMRTGMGRNYIIRRNGKIIAHIATYAEKAGIAVTSGLIVHPEYRDYPYGTMMESYLVNRLKEEKLRVYTFVNERRRAKLLRAMGNRECGEYEKLTRREHKTNGDKG